MGRTRIRTRTQTRSSAVVTVTERPAPAATARCGPCGYRIDDDAVVPGFLFVDPPGTGLRPVLARCDASPGDSDPGDVDRSPSISTLTKSSTTSTR